MAIPSHCIYCGGLVSSEADECPHCGLYPRQTKAFDERRPSEYAPGDSFTCPVCRTKWTPDTFRFQYRAGMEVGPDNVEETQKCPNDGHPIRVHTCEYCRKGVFPGTGRTVVQYGTTIYYHVACFNKVQPKDLGNPPSRQGCTLALLPLFLLALCAAALACWSTP